VSRSGEQLVEAAIREGKFPESRRAHYMALMARKPKKTAKLIARLEPGMLDHLKADDEEERQAVQQAFGHEAQAAPAGATSSGPTGPTAYPKEWLGAAAAGSVVMEQAQADRVVVDTGGGGVPRGHDLFTFENDTVRAQAIPGANVQEGLG
jgi:hypothetical protein